MANITSDITQPLWRLGFRPFFLLGSILAPISLAVWLLSFSGMYQESSVNYLWHAHEMLYGYVIAIVVGFLLTASANWSGKKGLYGGKLATLTTIWLFGRILFLVPTNAFEVRAGVDLIFLPSAIFLLYPYLKSAGNKKNLMFAAMLTSLWLCNLAFHLDSLDILAGYARKSLLVAVQIIILIVVVISGRVIPFFTEKAVPNYVRKKTPWLERLVYVSTLFFIGTYIWSESGLVVFIAAISAGICHSMRLVSWFDRGIWQKPILLILYIGYGWIAVAFFTSGFAALGMMMPSSATHAFTVGAISTMIIGMMTRVSLGHTGRIILASKRTILAYLFVFFGATIRVIFPLLFPAAYLELIVTAGCLWISSLLLFIWEYAPILSSARLDGKPG